MAESSMGPSYRAMMPRMSSSIPEDTKGKVPYRGYETSVMQDFIATEERFPRDRRELNVYIKYNRPGWPMMKEAQFQNTLASMQRRMILKSDKSQAADEKENRVAERKWEANRKKGLESLRKRATSRVSELKKDINAFVNAPFQKGWGVKTKDTFDALPNELQKGFKEKLRKDLLDNAKKTDEQYQSDLKARAELKESKYVPIKAPRRQAPAWQEKDRPSGGGSIGVTGPKVGEGDAQQGTVLTTSGAYGNAQQYKFTPIDEAAYQSAMEQDRPYTGEYTVHQPRRGLDKNNRATWKESVPISAGELYRRTKGKFGEKGIPKGLDFDVPPAREVVEDTPSVDYASEMWEPNIPQEQPPPIPETLPGEMRDEDRIEDIPGGLFPQPKTVDVQGLPMSLAPRSYLSDESSSPRRGIVQEAIDAGLPADWVENASLDELEEAMMEFERFDVDSPSGLFRGEPEDENEYWDYNPEDDYYASPY